MLRITKPESDLFFTMITRLLQSIEQKLQQLSPTLNAKQS